ncbi:Cytochrome P450 family protein [Ceratobasidium theobromae]|uniref:Cytochrome P450 family protein n=1 Tax=Ceratobasidium theobromae TaxID=1582974 RepID=A0A5N5QG25_9AGAM|nr:Cytochrome P450 family protein [Ceratobasidium theobromae]
MFADSNICETDTQLSHWLAPYHIYGAIDLNYLCPEASIDWLRGLFSPSSASRPIISPQMKLKDHMIQAMGGDESREINLLEWCKASTLESIGEIGFGYSFGAIQGTQSSYMKAIQSLMPTIARIFGWLPYLSWARRLLPTTMGQKIIRWIPNVHIQSAKAAIDAQREHARNILKNRREVISNGVDKEFNDILSNIIQINTRASKDDKLSEDQIIGQINGALARVLHILSEHPVIQDRLRAELVDASPELQNYDKLSYLDAVIRETLRLYPPTPTIIRHATRDWVLPLRYPTEQQKEIYVKEGAEIRISLRNANRCKETWGSDAEEFKPERWLSQLPLSALEAKTPGINLGVEGSMTFSAGPRACIGYKFAILQLKSFLFTLIKSFHFAPGSAPIEWRAAGFTTPHIMIKTEKGELVMDRRPSLPLKVSPVC